MLVLIVGKVGVVVENVVNVLWNSRYFVCDYATVMWRIYNLCKLNSLNGSISEELNPL